MAWAKPKGYSHGDVNRAGDILISPQASEMDKNRALEILDNWRAIHSYPMHVFKQRLREKARFIDKNSLIVQRLKRVPAILAKLERRYGGHAPTMQLSQMQDLGGCRAVLNNVALARKLYEDYYLKGDLKHKKFGEKDYIKNPKSDGYRSIHLIYKYHSDKGKKEYNGLLIEIQIRSRLQHLWATAIETVDFFTWQAIKSSEGEKEWMEFFRLVSAAFAKIEDCPAVPNTPLEERELYLSIKEKEAQLNVIKVMKGWTQALRIFEQQAGKMSKQYQYFLLELNISREQLNISVFTRNQEQKAIQQYTEIEKKNIGKKEFDVVLVGADNLNDLKKAYPNYFVDSGEFLTYIQNITSHY